METILALLTKFDYESRITNDSFEPLVTEILSNYQIQSVTGEKFSIEEIEFYFFNQYHLDTSTHRHGMDVGQWRVHYSGIDITFQGCSEFSKSCKVCSTCKELSNISYGGILIRSISNEQETISGPLRVQTKLLSGGSIIGSRGLQLIKSNGRTIKHEQVKRIGINHPEEYKDCEYGFYNPENQKLVDIKRKRNTI